MTWLDCSISMRINWGFSMIFLDTSYHKALLDEKDVHHNDAIEIKDYIENINTPTVINTTVLVETLNKSFKIKIPIEELFNNLIKNNDMVTLTNKDYQESLDVSRWLGYSINYSDCTIVNTMIKEGIRDIVTFDSDFKKINSINVIYKV